MPEEERASALRLLKALADETRLRILGLLAQHGELNVSDLAHFLGLRDPTVSHHLAALRDTGLVSVREEGTAHFYAFRPDELRAQNRTFLAPERVSAFADASSLEGMGTVEEYDRKVLRDFLDGPVLRQIPAVRRKRQVILRYLLQDFEPGRTYPEAEVNLRLKAHHPDCATLRREFVAAGLMAREHGLYWRVDIGIPPTSPPPPPSPSAPARLPEDG